MNLLLLQVTPHRIELPYVVVSLIIGVFFLIVPAYKLYQCKERLQAEALFKRASYYPLALMVVIGVRSIL